MFKKKIIYWFFCLVAVQLSAQVTESTFVPLEVPSQNQVKFNRFLLNPTFSTVREDKSYINLFHRNQSALFEDNDQTYFLSYSGRVGDKSGVGLSLYAQREGLFNNFGVLANYAYGVKLSDKSNFTFGANFSYYNSGFNRSRSTALDDDPLISGLENSSLLSFQPGFNLSYGKFDFGLFAENLFDYNLSSGESITDFNEKTYSGHLQYTHQFENASGLFEKGRLLPIARVRRPGEQDIELAGNLILDLPKLGWLQAGYDSFYGASAGVGFNLGNRISLGYTVERGFTNTLDNLGPTHEISLAYSFTPTLTEDRVLLEKQNEELVENSTQDSIPSETLNLTDKDVRIAALEKKLAENDAILEELLLRQDSIENSRNTDLERRFETVMRMVRRESAGRPELEQRATDLYFKNLDSTRISITPKSQNPFPSETAVSIPPQDKLSLPNSASTKKKESRTTRPKVSKDNIPTLASSKAASKKTLHPYNIPNVSTGHYLIANVFKNPGYRDAFVTKLVSEGFDADYFINPKNGYSYVHILAAPSRNDALKAYTYHSQGNGYSGDLWVMDVRGSDQLVSASHLKTNASRYGNTVLTKNTIPADDDSRSPASFNTYNLNGVASGFYLVVNVFEKPQNANRFVKQLNAQGLSASYFINPENKYRYVYIKKHEKWANALSSYYSKVNDSYTDSLWIMRVKPNPAS